MSLWRSVCLLSMKKYHPRTRCLASLREAGSGSQSERSLTGSGSYASSCCTHDYRPAGADYPQTGPSMERFHDRYCEAHFPEITAAYKRYTEPSPTVGGILQAPIMNISARWFIRLPLAMVCPDIPSWLFPDNLSDAERAVQGTGTHFHIQEGCPLTFSFGCST